MGPCSYYFKGVPDAEQRWIHVLVSLQIQTCISPRLGLLRKCSKLQGRSIQELVSRLGRLGRLCIWTPGSRKDLPFVLPIGLTLGLHVSGDSHRSPCLPLTVCESCLSVGFLHLGHSPSSSCTPSLPVYTCLAGD